MSPINPESNNVVTSISQAVFFAQSFSGDFSLDESGHIPPTYPLSDFTMPVNRIFNNDVLWPKQSEGSWT